MDNIGIGILGAGPMAGIFAAQIDEVADAEVRALCAAADEDPAPLAERHEATLHATVADLAADPTLDAVYVASGNALHEEHATALLRAGKHVLVEKPMALNAAQVSRMIAEAADAGRLLMELYPAPFEPNIRALRDSLSRVTGIRRAVFVKDQYSSAFDAFRAGGSPAAFDLAQGGGSILDLGFYGVSLAVHLFGTPSTLTATGLKLDGGVDGQGTITLGYDDFQVDCLHSKIGSAGIDSQIAGEHSALVLDDISVPTRLELRTKAPSRRLEVAETLTQDRDGSHLRYGADAFLDLLRAGAVDSPVHPLEHVLEAHALLDEARRQVGVPYPADSSTTTNGAAE